MKNWAILAVLLGWCGTIQAEPLDLRQVSGDAKWLVHLDVDAMRQSSLMEKAYLAGTQQWTELQSWLATSCEEVGVDPRLDLHGITVFGKKLGRLEGIAIVNAKMRPDVMVGRAMAESGYGSSKYGDHKIHSWTDGEETVTGAFYKPSLLVIARTEAEVRHALDVLDGKAPTLAARRNPVVAEVPEGSMALAWAEGLADSALPFRSAAITKSESIGVLIGEKGGEVFGTLRLAMQNKDTAQKMLTVLQGVRSAAELQYADNSGTMKILDKFILSASEKTVSAELRAPAESVWSQVKVIFAIVKGLEP
jgi:hypothetical protein